MQKAVTDMALETERLYFRHWTIEDKYKLFKMAKDPDIGYRCELGYRPGRDYRGKGIMPEACRELIRHALNEIRNDYVNLMTKEDREYLRNLQE